MANSCLINSSPCGLSRYVNSCAYEAEVPFGRLAHPLFRLVRDGRKCVRFSVYEGGQTEWRWVGRDGLLVWGIRERTPLGVQGLVGKDGLEKVS